MALQYVQIINILSYWLLGLCLLETFLTRGRAQQDMYGNWCFHHWWQSLTGGKMNTLNEEFNFLHTQQISNYSTKQKEIQ
jgi:hypothetical protein